MIRLAPAKITLNAGEVNAAVRRGERRYLMRAGALARQIMRRSIRTSKKTSTPGQPPRSHQGDLRGLILFDVDTGRGEVVVGPRLANKLHFDTDMRPVRGTVPQLLEEGGQAYVVEYWAGEHWRRLDLRRRGAVAAVGALRASPTDSAFAGGRPVRRRAVRVAARPFARPALEATRPRLPGLWADAVR